MIYYRNTLFGSGPKLTAVHWANTALLYEITLSRAEICILFLLSMLDKLIYSHLSLNLISYLVAVIPKRSSNGI